MKITLCIKGRAMHATVQLQQRKILPTGREYREVQFVSPPFPHDELNPHNFYTTVQVESDHERIADWYSETPNAPPPGGHPAGTLLHYRYE